MPKDLDQLLGALRGAPLDHPLDTLAGDVARQLAERRAATAQTWGLRGVAVALVTMTGIAISAAIPAAAATEPASPFAAWSPLAPSLLLGTSS